MTWRYQKVGRHIHIFVFLDDGRTFIGKLVVTKTEFQTMHNLYKETFKIEELN